MKSPSIAAIAAPAAVLLASCILDLGDLSGGHPAGGAGGGGSATSSASSASSSASSSGGTGGAAGVLDCAPCPGGGCAATVLASGTDATGPDGIALTDEGLYWVNRNAGKVMRLAASGGPPTMLATATSPVAVAAAGGYAVWAQQDAVYGCTVNNCGSSRIKIATATLSGSIQGVAYDGQYVFYTDKGSAPSTGKAVRCPPTAGCPGALTLGNNLSAPVGIALHNDQVFWTEQANGNQNGNIDQSSKGGSGQNQITAGLDLPTAVVADDLHAYWTQSTPTGGKISRCPYSAGYCTTPLDIATGLAAPLDIALGGGRVYWTDSGDGKVLSCPTTGCGGAPRAHATGRAGLRRIALGPTCVFWTDDQGGGSVSKVGR